MLHPVYLPFSEDQLKQHFVDVQTASKHVNRYKASLERYALAPVESEDRKGLALDKLKVSCQVEKDEQFWTVSALMGLYHSPNRERLFGELLQGAFGCRHPTSGMGWEECLNGDLHLFFEANLPSPATYKKWMGKLLGDHQFIPYILDAAGWDGRTCHKANLEGATNVDALLVNQDNGFAVLFEAKVLSDISYMITYCVNRNQMARNIDVMLEDNNENELHPALRARDPELSLFALITPDYFREHHGTRLYWYKFQEYKSGLDALMRDLPHRMGDSQRLSTIPQRLGWVTWEDFNRVKEDCCAWLKGSQRSDLSDHGVRSDLPSNESVRSGMADHRRLFNQALNDVREGLFGGDITTGPADAHELVDCLKAKREEILARILDQAITAGSKDLIRSQLKETMVKIVQDEVGKHSLREEKELSGDEQAGVRMIKALNTLEGEVWGRRSSESYPAPEWASLGVIITNDPEMTYRADTAILTPLAPQAAWFLDRIADIEHMSDSNNFGLLPLAVERIVDRFRQGIESFEDLQDAMADIVEELLVQMDESMDRITQDRRACLEIIVDNSVLDLLAKE